MVDHVQRLAEQLPLHLVGISPVASSSLPGQIRDGQVDPLNFHPVPGLTAAMPLSQGYKVQNQPEIFITPL